MAKKFLRSLAMLLIVTMLIPVSFAANADTSSEPDINGVSAIVMDMDTGEVIYSKNADAIRSPASTTKLLTAYIFAQYASESDKISYSDYTTSITATSLNYYFMSGDVQAGDTISADDAMKALLIFSANDIAAVMAEYVSGSVDDFAELMNETAAELGCTNSNFVNANGLEESSEYNTTTAYDLALIATAAYNNDWIRETMSEETATISLNGYTIDLETRNQILGEDGNVGGKTGTETEAGHCFVGYFEEDGRNLVTVVLGADYGVSGEIVFEDTEDIADYASDAEEAVYLSAGSEVGTAELEYKLFGFFGPTKTITASITLDDDLYAYENDYNETYAEITYDTSSGSAWAVAANNNVDLTYSVSQYSEDITGTIDISIMDILKANLAIYIATLLFIIIIVTLIILLSKIIKNGNRSKHRRRSRGRHYR